MSDVPQASSSRWFFQSLLASVVIASVTFPVYEPAFGPGIDGPLLWVYNYIFANNLSLGQFFIFPFGPLAFLNGPLPIGNNLVITASAQSSLAVLFSMCGFALTRGTAVSQHLLTAAILVALLLLLNFLLLLIGTVALLFLLSLESKQMGWALVAAVFCGLAMLVKSYSGLIAWLMCFSFAAIAWNRYRNLKSSVMPPAVMLLTYILTWLALYHNFNGSIRFLYGTFQLSSGNTNAMGLYPENNWWLLSLAGFAFAALPWWCRNKKLFGFYALFLLAVFGAWKHGMVREDVYHARGLFLFVCLFFGLMMIYVRGYFVAIGLTTVVTLSALWLNLRGTPQYDGLHVNTNRLPHLIDFTFHHNSFKERYKSETTAAISAQRIDNALVETVGSATVDVYPWDYSYIAANPQLNWQPRSVIQSYAAFTPWLDKQNAEHFASTKAPDFILWHVFRHAENPFANAFQSIDHRYILNDEPETMLEILKRYTPVWKSDSLMLWQKLTSERRLTKTSIGESNVAWHQWINVPENNNGILRADVQITNNLLGKIKTALYKNEAVFMDAALESGDVFTQRIVPGHTNALWINPLITRAEAASPEPRVIKIRFRCSDTHAMRKTIDVRWERVDARTPQAQPISGNNLFGKNALVEHKTILTLINNFTATGNDSVNYRSRPFGFKIAAQNFSPSLEVPLLSLKPDSGDAMVVMFGAWVKAPAGSNAKLVITIENKNENKLWKGRHVSDAAGPVNDWNYINVKTKLNGMQTDSTLVLKAYVWNNDNRDLLIDDMELRVERAE